MRRPKYPTGMSAMAKGLAWLRAGLIDFNGFERMTRQDWTRLAKMLHGRWPLPIAVSVEDVRQELLLAVIERKATSGMRTLVERWEPGPGRATLDRYVVWNACIGASRWLHDQRGAKRTKETGDIAGKIKSAFFPTVAAVTSVRGDEAYEPGLEVPVDALQEQHAIIDSAIRQVLARGRNVDRTALAALVNARGDLDEAARAFLAEAPRDMLGGKRSVAQAATAITNAMGHVQTMLAG